jgi:patatin-like phospholipase/acyl hydrolase
MKILSIDGGGIRGIIPGQVLVALEQKIQTLTNDNTKRIADVFDLIAGTSTGGILTCLYLCPDGNKRPKFSALDAVNLYLQNGDDIFDVSVFKQITSLGGITDEKYNAGALERILHKYFGDLRLSQLLKSCLITSYDINRRAAKFFNRDDVKEEGQIREFYVRDIARATSAAPTYFEPANITSLANEVFPLIDGGVFANNPAMCAFVEACSADPALKVSDLFILSLGTGSADKPYHYSEAKNWGKLGWALPILDVLMSGVAETVDYQLKTLFKSAKRADQYLRVDVDLNMSPRVDNRMDNASEENMRELEEVGKGVARVHDAALNGFLKLLLKEESNNG